MPKTCSVRYRTYSEKLFDMHKKTVFLAYIHKYYIETTVLLR